MHKQHINTVTSYSMQQTGDMIRYRYPQHGLPVNSLSGVPYPPEANGVPAEACLVLKTAELFQIADATQRPLPGKSFLPPPRPRLQVLKTPNLRTPTFSQNHAPMDSRRVLSNTTVMFMFYDIFYQSFLRGPQSGTLCCYCISMNLGPKGFY